MTTPRPTTSDLDHDALAALPLTPEATTTERQRIRNLIDQFERGFHTADEMPGLILATLDAERHRPAADTLAALREALDAIEAEARPLYAALPGESHDWQDGVEWTLRRVRAALAAAPTPEADR